MIKMKLVCLGDSLTFGYGVFKNQCWIELIRQNFNIEILNKGINGDTTAGMLSRSFNDVVENNPSHVIIMGGCNDFMAGRSLNNVKENMIELIKEALNNNIIPILGIEPPIEPNLAKRKWCWDLDYSNINSIEANYRTLLIDFCTKNNIHYIDFYKIFQDELKTKDPKELYVDGLHPTPLGHEIMSNLAIDTLKSYYLKSI